MKADPLRSWVAGTVSGPFPEPRESAAPGAAPPAKPPARASTASPGRCTGWRLIDVPVPSHVAESHSRFLHVSEPGAVLRRAGTRLRVTRKEDVLLEIPITKLMGVLVYGNVQVSTQCLRNLLDEGVWLSFFTGNGVYKGRLQPPAERGGRLRLRQRQRAADVPFCLSFSRALVRAKILGQKAVAAAFAKNYLAETLGEGHTVLRESLARVTAPDAIRDLDELRGIEGSAARAYFGLFRRWNQPQMPFDGRVKHPATDPVNALLSFGYTLLTRELEGLLESAGLDPTVGFYHAPSDDRPSLACDWVEEFRHVLVDRLVLRLINLGTIKASDFDEREEKGLRLTQEGLRKFLRAWERALIVPDEEQDDAKAGFRTLFLKQLGALLECLATAEPYVTHLDR